VSAAARDHRTRDRLAVAGIVLAGGRAARFGRDKLAEPVAGRPLLHHALLALAPVVDELVVVIRPHGAPPRLPPIHQLGVPVRLVRDPEPYGGPLVALATALETVHQPLAILAAGDMPDVRPPVARALFDALDEHDVELAVLAGPGPFQTLPAAVRVVPASAAARAALAGDSRAIRALYDRLRAYVVPEPVWRALDPEGDSLRDVDTPADLEQARDRDRPAG